MSAVAQPISPALALPLSHPGTSARRLPPSARDFLIYQRVVIDLASTRQTAQDAGLSQTRVRQIARRVIDWLADTLPAETEAVSAAYLRVAQHLAADRLEHFYQSAAQKWETTEQCRFASLAIRISQAQSKLPVIAGAIDALIADALDSEVGVPHATEPTGSGVVRAESSPSETTHLRSTPDPLTPHPDAPPPPSFARPAPPLSVPPIEDCSPIANSKTDFRPPTTPPRSAPPTPTTTSDTLPTSTRAVRAKFLSPAHLPSDDSDSSAITELKITPITLGLTMHHPLSRRERRRRQRLLAKH